MLGVDWTSFQIMPWPVRSFVYQLGGALKGPLVDSVKFVHSLDRRDIVNRQPHVKYIDGLVKLLAEPLQVYGLGS